MNKAGLVIALPTRISRSQYQQGSAYVFHNRSHIKHKYTPTVGSAPTDTDVYSLLRYVNAVICSDTKPMRKTITAALHNSVLMLVRRPS